MKIHRTIDMLAYGSLLLDVCIAIVTGMSLLKITSGEFVLVPINYMLTSVVIMSLLSGAMLIYLKHNEDIMDDMMRVRYRIRRISAKNKPPYTVRQGMKRRMGKIRKRFI